MTRKEYIAELDESLKIITLHKKRIRILEEGYGLEHSTYRVGDMVKITRATTNYEALATVTRIVVDGININYEFSKIADADMYPYRAAIYDPIHDKIKLIRRKIMSKI